MDCDRFHSISNSFNHNLFPSSCSFPTCKFDLFIKDSDVHVSLNVIIDPLLFSSSLKIWPISAKDKKDLIPFVYAYKAFRLICFFPSVIHSCLRVGYYMFCFVTFEKKNRWFTLPFQSCPFLSYWVAQNNSATITLILKFSNINS